MPRLLSQKEFLKIAKKVHGNKYDYSKTKYTNARKKISIICKKHGNFKQSVKNHLWDKCGCPKCRYEKISVSVDEFKQRVKKKFGNYFDLSKVKFRILHEAKITIICPNHGEFKRDGREFYSSNFGCYRCYRESNIHLSGERKGKPRLRIRAGGNHGNVKQPLDKRIFFDRCYKFHKDRYDYSLVKFKRLSENITIICKKHGKFSQRAQAHALGQGCLSCWRQEQFFSQNKIIDLFKKKLGNRYNYSKVVYTKMRKRVKIICKKHNLEFSQSPEQHLMEKLGCSKCKSELFFTWIKKLKLTKKEIRKRITLLHGNKYTYPKLKFNSIKDKIKIVCKKHGPFMQMIDSHLNKNKPAGCPSCDLSGGEEKIRLFLISKNIDFIEEWRDHDCVHKSKLRFDFFLPKKNCLIEYDGRHHFQPIDFFGGKKSFKLTKIRDKIKNRWAKKNKIKMIRVKYNVKNIHQRLANVL